LEKHLHGVCDMLESERTSRRQDMAMHMSILQELRSNFDAEKVKSDILENKLREVREDVVSKVELQIQSVVRANSETEAFLAENRARILEIEERCNSMQNRIATSSWHASNVERQGGIHERVAETLGSLRKSGSANQNQIQSIVGTCQDLNTALKETDQELRELHLQERQAREEHIMRTHKSLLSEQTRQIAELERRLNIRLQEEQIERERSVQLLTDEVTAMLRDDKALKKSDRTVVKRSASAGPTVVATSAAAQGTDTSNKVLAISRPALVPTAITSPGVSVTTPTTIVTTNGRPAGQPLASSVSLPTRAATGTLMRSMIVGGGSARGPSPKSHRGVTSTVSNLVPHGEVVRV